MEGIAVKYFPNPNDLGRNETKHEFHLYISDNNEKVACNSHAHMVHLFNKFVELGLLVSSMNTAC